MDLDEQNAYKEAIRRIESCRKSQDKRLFLDLSIARLADLPLEIAQLSRLEGLTLWGTQIKNLPSEIGTLVNLKNLDLSLNGLKNLPSEIGKLVELENLDLSHNQLTDLPLELGSLPKLERIYLQGNQLDLPSEMLDASNMGEDPTDLRSSAKKILTYFYTHREAASKEGTEPLLEAKVLVLGEASVGKSCLIAALTQNLTRDQVSDTGTRGIIRQLWETPIEGEMLRLNCWDFGGQEIYHSAHTLFLTTRAVYLIVVSKRDNDRKNNIDYWLRMAVSYGGPDAVIYVIVNKCDEKVGHPPDEQALKIRHPQIRGFLQTSCDDLRGIPEAREVIINEAFQLDGVRHPVARSWLAIKKRLEKMSEHTLSMSQWEEICGDDVPTADAQKELLHLCDRLGTVRYFPTTKDGMIDACETAILNPEWVTLGIYALLDDVDLANSGGLLTRSNMNDILKDRGYPPEHGRIIEEVMRRYDLLYDSVDHGPSHRMLIPLLLPELMPDLNWDEQDGVIQFHYQYQVMPAGLLPAFMARMHECLSSKDSSWRHGCVIEKGGCRARIIADLELKRVLISVQGDPALRRDFLDNIRFAFGMLHKLVEKLPVDELIPVPNRPDAPMIKYSYLRSLDWKGIPEFEAEGSSRGETITVRVREALDGVRGVEQRKIDEREKFVTNIHIGDKIEGDKNMNNDNSISVGGDNYGQVAQIMKNCSNLIQSQNSGEKKVLLEELKKNVEGLIGGLPDDKKKGPAEDLELLVKAVNSDPPKRKWYEISSEGLMEASSWVNEFTANITDAIKKLGRLTWPDYPSVD